MLNKALSFHQRGQLLKAAALYHKILAQNPKHADALHLLGVIEFQRKNPTGAIALIDRAIGLSPNNATFFSNRGAALKDLKRFDEALASYDRALAIKPDFAEALNNRGLALQELRRFDDALESYRRSLALKPNYAKALNNRGLALRQLRRFDEALASYDRALAIEPDYAEALSNRGNALRELKRFDDALGSYDLALAIKPDSADTLSNRGVVLQDLKRLEEALVSYDRALTIKPDYAEALNNRGNVLRDLKRFNEALANYDRALTIEPRYAEALSNRGHVLKDLKRFDEALDSFDRASAIEPDNAFLFGLRLFCKMTVSNWSGLGDDVSRLTEMIVSRRNGSEPFCVLTTSLSAALQKDCSETYVRDKHPPSSLLPKFKAKYQHERIRLCYFSADFRNHPIAYLAAGLFEGHDREQFEVIGFSLGPAKNDAMRMRLENTFDRFFEVGAMSDKDVALLARSFEIDIAVDLNGFTQGNRTDIFAMRPAPVQVNYLGYPGTMGATYIDYLIADSILIPNEERRHYVEKIAYLPYSYQTNDLKRPIGDKLITRAECGLPQQGFVFCCFNNNYKIAPDIFDIWMRLLGTVEKSVLWLLEDNISAARNLRAEARCRGIAPERLVFATRTELPDHLARHRLADLFLDTLPYNAHTTASDALWAGLPLLTCLGKTFPGRVAASLLNAIGLPELVTQDLDAYEALALQLATNPQMLLSLRQRLASNRLTHPLFDAALFTKHIESAYVTMWERHQAGEAPEDIHVPSESEPARRR